MDNPAFNAETDGGTAASASGTGGATSAGDGPATAGSASQTGTSGNGSASQTGTTTTGGSDTGTMTTDATGTAGTGTTDGNACPMPTTAPLFLDITPKQLSLIAPSTTNIFAATVEMATDGTWKLDHCPGDAFSCSDTCPNQQSMTLTLTFDAGDFLQALPYPLDADKCVIVFADTNLEKDIVGIVLYEADAGPDSAPWYIGQAAAPDDGATLHPALKMWTAEPVLDVPCECENPGDPQCCPGPMEPGLYDLKFPAFGVNDAISAGQVAMGTLLGKDYEVAHLYARRAPACGSEPVLSWTARRQ